ncbi:MAG: translation initiation factor [Verrucomicrobiota bacterium]
MSKKKRKLSTEGGNSLGADNPFGSLDFGNLPDAPAAEKTEPMQPPTEQKTKNRGRVDVVRKRSSGGAGWVTVVQGFVGISNEEKNELKKQIQKRCGTGGSLKDGKIEIQGDKREEIKGVLEKAKFRVVFAGG